MSATADTVTLQAYDLQGNIFYTYDFLRSTNLDEIHSYSNLPTKRWEQNRMFIYHDERIYDILGTCLK